MDIQQTFDRIKNIIISPNEEWDKIKEEAVSNQDLIVKYALPLIVLAGVTSFIGNFLLPGPLTQGFQFGYSLSSAIAAILPPFISIIVAAFVMNELATSFQSTKNLNRAFKLVVYAYTPGLVAAIIANLSIFLAWVGLFGLYGIYLFWIGVPKMMDTPSDKRLLYVIVAFVVIVIVNLIIGSILAGIGLTSMQF